MWLVGAPLVRALVDDSVTVVVDAVAALRGERMHIGIAIIAIRPWEPARDLDAESIRRGLTISVAVLTRRHVPVAVVIEAIACLDRAGMHRGIVVVAVAKRHLRTTGETVAVAVLDVLTERSIAVVVDPVAALDRPWMNLAIGIVAVVASARERGVPIAISVRPEISRFGTAVARARATALSTPSTRAARSPRVGLLLSRLVPAG